MNNKRRRHTADVSRDCFFYREKPTLDCSVSTNSRFCFCRPNAPTSTHGASSCRLTLSATSGGQSVLERHVNCVPRRRVCCWCLQTPLPLCFQSVPDSSECIITQTQIILTVYFAVHSQPLDLCLHISLSLSLSFLLYIYISIYHTQSHAHTLWWV